MTVSLKIITPPPPQAKTEDQKTNPLKKEPNKQTYLVNHISDLHMYLKNI